MYLLTTKNVCGITDVTYSPTFITRSSTPRGGATWSRDVEMRGCFTIHYNGETSPGSTPRSELLKPFLSGLRKVCDISIRLRHRTPPNPWVQDVLQWRVFEALLYSVRTDLRLADPAVTIFSSVLKFRCFSCTLLTKLRDKLCNSKIFLRIPLCVNCLLT